MAREGEKEKATGDGRMEGGWREGGGVVVDSPGCP